MPAGRGFSNARPYRTIRSAGISAATSCVTVTKIPLIVIVHLGAEVRALRLQMAHQNFHSSFYDVLPLKVLMHCIQAMRDCV